MQWIRRFILFHGRVHPQNLAKVEVVNFSSRLIMVREDKGWKDRRAILPLTLVDELGVQIEDLLDSAV